MQDPRSGHLVSQQRFRAAFRFSKVLPKGLFSGEKARVRPPIINGIETRVINWPRYQPEADTRIIGGTEDRETLPNARTPYGQEFIESLGRHR
jgi:hypothetical protein